MKILILNGSPRMKGNTNSVSQLLKAQLEPLHEVEILNVTKLNLTGCLGCYACRKNGGHCICKDDSNLLNAKVEAADAVIFATPVYWWGISGQLKTAIDKFQSRSESYLNQPKKVGLVMIGADALDSPQYRLIREQFDCITNFLHWELVFSLPLSALEPGEVLAQCDINERVQQCADSLIKALH